MSKNSKNLIIKTTFLLLKNNDLNTITFKDISDLANISRKTVYNNFKNITEIINNKENELIIHISNLYKLNKIRNKSDLDLFINILEYVYKNRIYFECIKNKLFVDFKHKLDNFFYKIVENKYEYIKVSGAFINLILFYLSNNIDIKDFINQIENSNLF